VPHWAPLRHAAHASPGVNLQGAQLDDQRGFHLHDGEAPMRDFRLFLLSPVLAAACVSTPSQGADDGTRYAAIWEKTAGPAFVARHSMSAQVMQQEFDKQMGQGWCITLINGYAADNQARYAAIWEQKNCPDLVARHGLTLTAYRNKYDTLVGQQGHRLKWMSATTSAGRISMLRSGKNRRVPTWSHVTV
jgi:hypothetical protein